MRATLLGFTVSDELLDKINAEDPLMHTQTHRFAWSLVSALQRNGVRVELLSTPSVSDFPANPRLVWRGRRFEARGTDGRLMPFVNAVVLKHLTRYVSCWLVGTRELRRARPDWIVVHGVHSPFLYYAIQVRRLIDTRVAVVLTDPPGVVRAEDGVVRRVLKRFDIGLVVHALRRSDAVIVLAEPLAQEFARDVPALVVEGLVAPEFGVSETSEPVAGRIVYAGGLHEAYGVRRLVEAVCSLPGNLELELYGRGPLEPWLLERARADPRIREPRLVPPRDLPGIYARASVLVQPRQVDQDFVRYSFPSKLIEYLASGRPVVSTRLPSIPEDYAPYLVQPETDAPGDLAAAIARVLAWPDDDRREFGSRGADFIRHTRSLGAQGHRIVEFLERVATSR